MSGARFWRNVAIIAAAHVVLIVAFVRWSGAAKSSASPQVVWLSGGAAANEPTASAGGAPPEATDTPEPQEQPTIAPAKSEIQLPTPIASATPRPIVKLSPPPVAKPAETPKPVVKARPKKSVAKATPKPQKKTSAESDDESAIDGARDALSKISGGGNGAGGTSTHAETQWYGRMLHDRFHNAWEQPTTVLAAGAKMSALVKARIEKDGHVSRFELVKPSGNVVVDESVRAVAGKVTQVDPLPGGVGNGDHYDVTINFELNPED